MSIFFTIFFISIIAIIALVIYISSGNVSTGGVEFIAKGKEAGLNSNEIKMLKKASDVLNLERPLTLFGSIVNVDNAISQITDLLKKSEYSNLDLIDLLEDLHQYRKNIELEKIDRRSHIVSTKEIGISQLVKITIGNLDNPLIGIVTENNDDVLSIDIKSETSIKPGLNWKGPINVYFWKKNDAGYYFESVVLKTPTIRRWNLKHSNNLIRNQKRDDLRIDVELNCNIYKLPDMLNVNSKPEGFCGIFAQLKNLSEGGAAFLVNGIIDNDIPIKVEFKIDGEVAVICGIVKKSSYNKSNNISYVRIKVIKPSFEMLSIIRPYIFKRSRELFKIKDINTGNAVENVEKIIDNVDEGNNTNEDDISEVEYLPDSDVLN